MRRLTQDEWVKRATEVHGGRYDYSKSIFIGTKKLIIIICPIHGEFEQIAGAHLYGRHGCHTCGNGSLLSKQQWIDKCNIVHNGKYDYSISDFQGVKSKIKIICPEHGIFEQIAEKHFIYGCQSCAGNKKITLNDFLMRANEIHNNKYDYSLVEKIFSKTSYKKVKIICPIHGAFLQNANNHLLGKGCIKCSVGNTSKIEQEWLDICGVPNDSLHRNVKITVGNKKFSVDGCYLDQKIIYEFLGDFWHGHPIKFNPEDINRVTKDKFIDLFNKTQSKIKLLREYGWKVISIWESTFIKRFKWKRY